MDRNEAMFMCLMFIKRRVNSRWIDVITRIYRSSVYVVEYE